MKMNTISSAHDSTAETSFWRGFWQTCVFFYEHSLQLVGISLAWILVSLPLVTVGPATLWAYTAIMSLQENHQIDHTEVVGTVSKQFLSSVLLGLVPTVLGGITSLYLVFFMRTPSLARLAITLILGYATVYSILVLIPSFVALAAGQPPFMALKSGRTWIGKHPIQTMSVGLATFLLLLITSFLTIAVVLVFPGFTFTLHVISINELV